MREYIEESQIMKGREGLKGFGLSWSSFPLDADTAWTHIFKRQLLDLPYFVQAFL